MLPTVRRREDSCLSTRARDCEEDALLFEGGFTFRNFVADAFAIFMFVLWFWLFVSVASDLFRRNDVSGWAKVLWVIALLLEPLAKFIERGEFSLCSRGGAAGAQVGAGLSCVTRSI